MVVAIHNNSALEWAMAGRPLPGEVESGDQGLVLATETGWLLAVADGLGHGREAAFAARTLIESLQKQPNQGPARLLQNAHQALRQTRGCAAAVAQINVDRSRLSWVGVGNVEGLVRSADTTAPSHYITMRGGIVGYRIPPIQDSLCPLHPGDLLMLATDGIDSAFAQAPLPALPPEQLAAAILARYSRPGDDALVLVARWLGPATEPEEDKP